MLATTPRRIDMGMNKLDNDMNKGGETREKGKGIMRPKKKKKER